MDSLEIVVETPDAHRKGSQSTGSAASPSDGQPQAPGLPASKLDASSWAQHEDDPEWRFQLGDPNSFLMSFDLAKVWCRPSLMPAM